MVICNAEARHIPGMIRLLRQVGSIHAQGRPDLFREGAQKYKEAQLEAILADPNSPIFIAEEAGRVLGYCFCQKNIVAGNACVNGRRELYIDDLCVDEACRGKHVGQALYRHTQSWAKAQGFAYITLHVWSFNESAEKFYRSLGMENRYICMEQKLEEQ